MGSTELAGAGEPFVALTYGPSGIGKSVCTGYSFPNALFIAAPGALNSILSVCGYAPPRVEVPDIAAATKLLREVGKSDKFDAVVIDDFSFLAEQTASGLEKKFSGFKFWGELRDTALELRNEARRSRVHVVMSCWETPPKIKDGMKVRGGPQLSGKLPESIPALCDVVLRAVHEPGRQPWPAAYRCSNDPNWVMKDRFNVASTIDPAPMNLAEILRAEGLFVSRHKDLPNQEAEVEAISQSLTGVMKDDAEQINEIYTALLNKGTHTVKAVRWTMRDAVDRAVIRAAKRVAVLRFFTSRPMAGL